MDIQMVEPDASNFPGGKAPELPNRSAAIGNTKQVDMSGDPKLIEKFNAAKRECFADRWVFERQWTRNIHYLNLRQWLAPYSQTDGWRDARLAKGVPKPSTSKPKEVDQAIRSMFASIRYGAVVRPQNQSPKAIVTAAICDDYAPVLHDLHDMNSVMNEFDYWFVNLGNAWLHTFYDEDARHGTVPVWYETCLACGNSFRADEIYKAGQRCPNCQAVRFMPALDQDGQPRFDSFPLGASKTVALSPLELAFPLTQARWSDVPLLIRMRWREKSYYEQHPILKALVPKLQWSKASAERSVQIFQSLALQNDIPTMRYGEYGGAGRSSSSDVEGISEYELWIRPCPEYPDGYVARLAGDGDSPVVLHLEDTEGIPGPIPYRDAKGRAVFTFTHAGYHQVGGRLVASGVHDPVVQKYDLVNRIDSLIEMIAMRMASPQWMLPKGAQVNWLGNSPGVPGLLLEWNSQIAGNAGRPERIPGMPPDNALIQWRKLVLEDIDDATGAYDLLRGAKPPGVDAFSAMQMLVESGQRRFASAFMARGMAYRDWFQFGLELERQFGPSDRTIALMKPRRGYAFKTFQKADLMGDVAIVIEDGTYTPKTSLGERAAIEHLRQLGYLDPSDTDQKWTVLSKFGMTALQPGLDANIQAALRKQEAFEDWIQSGAYRGMPLDVDPQNVPGYPLRWQPWYDAMIHRQEFIKWANGDSIVTLCQKMPPVERLLAAHLAVIDVMIQQKQEGVLDPVAIPAVPAPSAAPAGDGQPGGAPAAAPPPPAGGGNEPQPPAGTEPPQPAQGAAFGLTNSNRNSVAALTAMPQNAAPSAPGAH